MFDSTFDLSYTRHGIAFVTPRPMDRVAAGTILAILQLCLSRQTSLLEDLNTRSHRTAECMTLGYAKHIRPRAC